jgi:hypothetical protein
MKGLPTDVGRDTLANVGVGLAVRRGTGRRRDLPAVVDPLTITVASTRRSQIRRDGARAASSVTAWRHLSRERRRANQLPSAVAWALRASRRGRQQPLAESWCSEPRVPPMTTALRT